MQVIVVLHRPQDVVNIAVVIRAMQNFGASRLRLVQPVEFEPYRIEGIAHKSRELIDRTEIFDDLDEALGDCGHVVGLTARGRTVKRNMGRPKDAAAELRELAESTRVALLFGPEDRGLSNADLDRCHRIVTIPTAPANSSLNLAQAATVMLYELFQAGDLPAFKVPRHETPVASRAMLEGLFADIESALASIEFFKSRTNASIMRAVREPIHRAQLDEREAALGRAMSREVLNYLRRKGIEPE